MAAENKAAATIPGGDGAVQVPLTALNAQGKPVQDDEETDSFRLSLDTTVVTHDNVFAIIDALQACCKTLAESDMACNFYCIELIGEGPHGADSYRSGLFVAVPDSMHNAAIVAAIDGKLQADANDWRASTLDYVEMQARAARFPHTHIYGTHIAIPASDVEKRVTQMIDDQDIDAFD